MGFRDTFGPEGRRKKEILKETEKMVQEALKKRSTTKKEEVTLKQKLLILDYLGIIKSLDLDNTKKAKLFSILLSQSEENIRKALGEMYVKGREIKTKKNLEYIHELFEELNLTKQKDQVIKDIEKFIEKD